MSMGIIRNGAYDKVAGLGGESKAVRKGNFVISWSSDTSIHYVKQNVAFATPMPGADYEVNFTYTDVANWAELMNIKVCEKTVNGFNILCSYTDYKYKGTISYTAFKVS